MTMRIPLVPWFSVIFCYWYWTHLSVAITMVHGQCLEDQQSLLLQLRSSLQFEHEISSKLVSWNESIDCCEWNGVKCDDKGHVSGLDLSEESIYDGFDNSSSLFNLQNLQVLNLATNNFNSVIPSGFNKLKNLTYLNLSHAGFVGQIPIEISQLARLVTLDISFLSYLTGQQLELKNPNLQKIVQNLTRIEQLYLDWVNISAQGQEWCNDLLQLPSLQEVSMSYCGLSGPLLSSLTRLKNLSVIRLDGNNLSSPVPETFVNFTKLTTLSLVDCGLRGKFPEKIFQISTLSFIDISLNEDLQGSLPEFPLNGALKTLVVGVTNLSGALPSSIGQLRHLSILDLSACNFNGTLPSSMSKLMELTHLDLSSNKFVGPIPSFNVSWNLSYLDMSHNFLNESLPSSLFGLPLLQIVRLSNNKLQGHLEGLSSISSTILDTLDLSSNNFEGPIPASIFQLTSLGFLRLSWNKFSGTVQLNMFQRLGNLIELDLSYNQLSLDANATGLHQSSLLKMRDVKLASCNLREFPGFLRNQSELFSLDLSSNNIQGSIPSWIWQLVISELNISHNLLTEIEGREWNTSASLSILDLHSNQLQGRLPLFLGAAYLDCSINNFSSIIPLAFGSHLYFPGFISLSQNSLSGSIPHSLCNISYMAFLDLSHNYFNGTIPQCLTRSETLMVLNLENNKLDGNITDTFPESCALRILLFNRNQLAGPIPRTLQNCRTLEVLNLGNNKLDGNITDTFAESCALRTLQLSSNQLVGPIPRTLQNCRTLEVLNLGNNQIFDVFPCFLKKLSTLHVMILRGNKLQGSIGCPKTTNTTWQMLQIVDLAFNNFGGSLTQFHFKTLEAMVLGEVHEALKFNQIQSRLNLYGKIYKDSVTLIIKSRVAEYFKIPFAVTSIDLSSNNLQGQIPRELMNLTGLHYLNLSHNALADKIPSAIGNLKQLESLDLSSNQFDGEIPTELASLTFLSYLNLSFNQFLGRIPTGTQLQSFSGSSYQGNAGLCGPPLTTNCSDLPLPPPPSEGNSDTGSFIEWNFLSIELGCVFGLGNIIFPILFWKRWRLWYWRHVDDLLFRVFPQLDFLYEHRGGQNYRTLRWRPY